jgi:hypothetical protein
LPRRLPNHNIGIGKDSVAATLQALFPVPTSPRFSEQPTQGECILPAIALFGSTFAL